MFNVLRKFGSSLFNGFSRPLIINKQMYGCFSNWMNSSKSLVQCAVTQNANFLLNSSTRSLLQANSNNLCLSRNVTKFSLKTGKKKSVGSVSRKFYRLHNGLWIRKFGGHRKKIYQKTWQEKYRLRQHVFCTRAQCLMFDKMTTDYYKKRRYFIDDPFEPYHVRHNFDYYVEKRKWVNLQKYNFKLI